MINNKVNGVPRHFIVTLCGVENYTQRNLSTFSTFSWNVLVISYSLQSDIKLT